jgi:hypothetical protein
MERKVISKSAKKKMSTPTRIKANGMTAMVVYTGVKNGKRFSITRHEPIKQSISV